MKMTTIDHNDHENDHARRSSVVIRGHHPTDDHTTRLDHGQSGPQSNFDRATDETLAAVKRIEAEIEKLEVERKRLRAELVAAVSATEERKIVRPGGTITLAAGKATLKVDDAAKLPKELTRVVVEPDKDAIIDLIESGRPVAGCSLARAAPHVVIRWAKGAA